MMRKVSGLIALGLGLGWGLQPAHAASFDGKWVADIPAQGRCTATGVMTLLVAGGELSGQVRNTDGLGNFIGKVDADGNATFVVNGSFAGTMTFRGDHFDATWTNNRCDRHATGDRALSDAQRAQAAADRKRHQDVYADLIQRAEAGDKAIDYTALRKESVYAKDWQFYDTKARGLLDQANAAAKGKDCAGAMDKLDQVLKLDFTMDSAHSLRSDCLKGAGERDKARIEADIAKGLIHSLMDSGHGDSEKDAYVVTTEREELDVLANRHIQLKTRETEIRGSDGRFFELAHGISIQGGGGIDVRTRNVYFDVSSFVNGRASRRAAEETAVATIQ